MKCVTRSIISPKGGNQYNNTVERNGKKITLNSSINQKDYKFTNRSGVVINTPMISVPFSVGDEVIVHHNTFKPYWGFNGDLRNSGSNVGDNEYSCSESQVFAYRESDDANWKTLNDSCFIKPIDSKDVTNTNKYIPLRGIVYIGNDFLTDHGVSVGDEVMFTPESEYQFTIDGVICYRMTIRDIICSYGKGN